MQITTHTNGYMCYYKKKKKNLKKSNAYTGFHTSTVGHARATDNNKLPARIQYYIKYSSAAMGPGVSRI